MRNVASQTGLHRTRATERKTVLSVNDTTTKFCTSFPVVHAVLRLHMSLLLVFCELPLGPRLEDGSAPRSELLFELLLVRE